MVSTLNNPLSTITISPELLKPIKFKKKLEKNRKNNSKGMKKKEKITYRIDFTKILTSKRFYCAFI